MVKIETKHHIVEFHTKKDSRKFLKKIYKKGITLDYYLWEFDLTTELYEIGEIPPLGHVPKQMYGWLIRKERHGDPTTAMKVEVVDTPKVGENDVLVMVMAAGVNYNGVWASRGVPIYPFDYHKAEFHIAGSDASGIIWAVGSKVKRWKVGDEVENEIEKLKINLKLKVK